MKTCRYIVEIEMPDGDMVSANWLKDIIQHDCEYEDKGRQNVIVRGLDLPEGLDEAAEESARSWRKNPDGSESRELFFQPHIRGFKSGAEWMAVQGWSRELEVKEDAGGYPYIDKHIELYDYDTDTPLAKKGDKVIVQIRKAE